MKFIQSFKNCYKFRVLINKNINKGMSCEIKLQSFVYSKSLWLTFPTVALHQFSPIDKDDGTIIKEHKKDGVRRENVDGLLGKSMCIYTYINTCTPFEYRYSCCVYTFLLKYGKKIYFIKIYLERKSNGKNFWRLDLSFKDISYLYYRKDE